MDYLSFSSSNTATFLTAGKFIATAGWSHMKRTIDSFEIILGLKGNLYIQEDDIQYTVEPGDILLIYPGHKHFGYCNSNSGDSFYWLHFVTQGEYEILDQSTFMQKTALIKNNPFLGLNEELIILPKYIKDVKVDRITILINQLLHIYKSTYYTKKIGDYILTTLLIELTNEQLLNINHSSDLNLNSKLTRILSWIKLNANKDIKIERMAEELSYNKDYLARFFKNNMGMGIKDYIVLLRLDTAKNLLFETNLSVKEIAYKVGFNDNNYFIKVFKKQEGITPTQFRNSFFNLHYNNC